MIHFVQTPHSAWSEQAATRYVPFKHYASGEKTNRMTFPELPAGGLRIVQITANPLICLTTSSG